MMVMMIMMVMMVMMMMSCSCQFVRTCKEL